MIRGTLILLTALSLLPTAASATNDVTAKADIRLRQLYDRHGGQQQAQQALQPIAERKLRTCQMCHGADGNSSRDVLPTLAGERPEYLLKRWYELVNGEGESDTASRMAKRISEEEMIALALYFSIQQRQPVAFDAALAATGKPFFEDKCQSCHHADGRGDKGMPIIASQQAEYMTRTLLQYREKTGWRHASEMPKTPTGLKPIEIKAAIHYAASLGQ
jgi:cytochrome c553